MIRTRDPVPLLDRKADRSIKTRCQILHQYNASLVPPDAAKICCAGLRREPTIFETLLRMAFQ